MASSASRRSNVRLGPTRVPQPHANPSFGPILRMPIWVPPGGDAGTAPPPSQLNRRTVDAGPDQGTVEATFNADNVTVGGLDQLTYNYLGVSYLYQGTSGTPATANPGDLVAMGTAAISIRVLAAGLDQGTVHDTFNNDSITVAETDVVFYEYLTAVYIYSGSAGSPVTGAGPTDFTQLTGRTAAAFYDAGIDQGTVQATFNNDAITVTKDDLVFYNYSNVVYLYTGDIGAPVTGATASDFQSLASVNARAIDAGTDQGSVHATWNADLITVVNGDIVFYNYNAANYLYLGPTGDPATGAGPNDFRNISGFVRTRAVVAGVDQGSVFATFNNDAITVLDSDAVLYVYDDMVWAYLGGPGAPVTGTTAADFQNLAATKTRVYTAGADQGTVADTFNNDGISVFPEDVVFYNYLGNNFLYSGPLGDPVTTATNPDFALTGFDEIDNIVIMSGVDQGTVEATFNNDAITVRANMVLFYDYGTELHFYTGPLGAPVTSAVATDFTLVNDSGSVAWKHELITVPTPGQASYTLAVPTSIPGTSIVTYGGRRLRFGVDYTLAATNLTLTFTAWPIEVGDVFQITYQ